tara:strand:+ start:408 stop:764 length:357 start_codon:yes stop_codon:yes gene_type:complete
MVLKTLYNSLSWTNKRRIDRWSERFSAIKDWVTPKAKKIVSEVEIPKLRKEKEVEVVTEIFPDDHTFIGYRIEKHSKGDKIVMIEEPPHPIKCTCTTCMDKLGDEIMKRRKVRTDESE